jgi:hypothetical protein
MLYTEQVIVCMYVREAGNKQHSDNPVTVSNCRFCDAFMAVTAMCARMVELQQH